MFRDDLNLLIASVEYRVQLRSVLDQIINERVVDQIEEGTPRNAASTLTADPKLLSQYKLLSREIVCALYVKETDANSWFPRFSSFKKGGLTLSEFKSALEQLDALSVLADPEPTLQSYYESMLQRQAANLGFAESVLLLDQAALMVTQDCPFKTRQKLTEDILTAVAYHLTDRRLPLGDIIKTFSDGGLVYRGDFQGQFLESYLKLFWNPKTGEGLSANSRQLLTLRYAPSPSVAQFQLSEFVGDMRRKEEENRASIRIYMTAKEAQEDAAEE
jgi:hypothetical protein